LIKHFSVILFLLSALALDAQDYPLTGHLQNIKEKDIYFDNNNTLIRPATGVENEIYDSLIFSTPNSGRQTWLGRKLFDEHFIIGKDERFKIILDPAVDFRLNRDAIHDLGYLNSRGIMVSGNLDSKIYFNTSFSENQGVMPFQIWDYYLKYGVIPGYGRVKSLSVYPLTGYNEYDFAAAYGSLAFKASPNLAFTIGYDKLFIGDGYRSLILSDYSAPMMYFKINAKFANFEYNNIFTKALNPNYNNISSLPEITSVNSRYPAKFISYNTLTYKYKNWQFSLIEALVMSEELPGWQILMNTATPFIRGAYNGFLPKPGNDLAGFNITKSFTKAGIFYSQIFIDRLFGSDRQDYALQLGYKDFDFLNLKNMFFLLEYNMASEKAYTFFDNKLHYSHYNQPLAHPAGNKFNELIVMCAYSINRFEVVLKLNVLKVGIKNIFDFYQPEQNYDNYNEAATAPYIINSDFQLIYNVNRTNKLQIFISLSPRIDFVLNNDLTFIQAGIRTALRSNYYDF
jgi:hypothetical protein